MMIGQLAVPVEYLKHQSGVPLHKCIARMRAGLQFLARWRLLKRKIHADKSGNEWSFYGVHLPMQNLIYGGGDDLTVDLSEFDGMSRHRVRIRSAILNEERRNSW